MYPCDANFLKISISFSSIKNDLKNLKDKLHLIEIENIILV